jgi:DNA-binding CsgD family transcriptional regulator
MRVVVVGPAAARARLRSQLADRGVDVVGELATLSAAGAEDLGVDAFVVTPPVPSPGLSRESEDDERPVVESLTPREVEVLHLLAEGLPNKAIAGRLAISDQTVKFHVASIYGKLGAANRTDAVRRAVRRGLVML